MNTTKIGAAFAAAAIAAAGAITALTAPAAIAEEQNSVNTTQLGSQAELADGDVVQGWTVTGLQVSTDTIPYPVQGTLWEATATDEALQGNATPIVSNFNARARDGQTYRALFGVATPQGVNPATLAQGQQTSGKIYFDVTGSAPDSVVYATNASDLIVWLTPPPAPSTGTGSTGGGSYQAPAELTQQVARELLDVVGQPGIRKGDAAPLQGELETAYRLAVINTFGGGANELQRDIIAMAGLGMPRAPRDMRAS